MDAGGSGMQEEVAQQLGMMGQQMNMSEVLLWTLVQD